MRSLEVGKETEGTPVGPDARVEETPAFVHAVDRSDIFLGKFDLGSCNVLRQSGWSGRLNKRDKASGHVPGQDNLGRGGLNTLSDVYNDLVGHGIHLLEFLSSLLLSDAASSNRCVALNMYAELLVERMELKLCEVGVEFNLVDRRLDLSIAQQVKEQRDSAVRHANGSDLSCLHKVF